MGRSAQKHAPIINPDGGFGFSQIDLYMQIQKHNITENVLPFAQPKFRSTGSLIFRLGAPDEEAYLGHVDTEDPDEALAEAKLRWPEYADDLWPTEANLTALRQTKIEAEMLLNPWPYAYHQAGYILAARSFGWTVTKACLRPRVHSIYGHCEIDPCSYGNVSLHDDDLVPANEREAGEMQAMYYLAGSIAKLRGDPTGPRCYDSQDISSAKCHIGDFADGCEEAYLEWLKARAGRLVARYWSSIELVAAALRKRRFLTGQELDELLTRSSPGTAG